MASFDHLRDHDEQAEPRRTGPRPPELGAVEQFASAVGNQAFGTLARDGAGILPSGMAHPDVEAAIARTRGRGSPLDSMLRRSFETQLGDGFGDVRVHTDAEADALARSVSARAFTTGADVYFAKGEYQPGTAEGRSLLGHELAHVVQQRGAPATGPLRVSMPGEPLEVEADERTRGVT